MAEEEPRRCREPVLRITERERLFKARRYWAMKRVIDLPSAAAFAFELMLYLFLPWKLESV
eukprot:1235394-Rhodomonas_salina.6